MIDRFFIGARDATRGAAFLAARPRLWGWIVAPALLALVILVAVICVAVGWAGEAIDWIVGFLPDSLERWIAGALTAVLVVALAFAGYVVFLGLAAIVAAPFNEMLSEAVEREVTGVEPPPFSPLVLLRDIALGIVHGARRVMVYLFTVAALFAVALIVPIAGPIVAAVLGTIVTARFAAYDAFDAVAARKGWAYGAKLQYLRVHRGRSYGLGAAVAALAAVPGLNLVALSVGATGATLAWLDEKPGRDLVTDGGGPRV
jgi:CysZ protein